MSSRVRGVLSSWYWVVLAGAMAFGASEAMAGVADGGECKFKPPTFLGECTSQTQCNHLCVTMYGGDHGLCKNGCCECFL